MIRDILEIFVEAGRLGRNQKLCEVQPGMGFIFPRRRPIDWWRNYLREYRKKHGVRINEQRRVRRLSNLEHEREVTRERMRRWRKGKKNEQTT